MTTDSNKHCALSAKAHMTHNIPTIAGAGGIKRGMFHKSQNVLPSLKQSERTISSDVAEPVDMCRGECPGAACCNTAQQSCDTPSVYVQASDHVVRC